MLTLCAFLVFVSLISAGANAASAHAFPERWPPVSIDGSCAVRGVGIGTCVAGLVNSSACTAPAISYPGVCPPGPTGPAQCCVIPNDARKRQPPFYQAACALSGAEPDHCAFLDDIYCQKTFPADTDRDFQCPSRFDADHLVGYTSATVPVSKIPVDTTALAQFVDSTVHMSLILIRRDSATGAPYFRYFGNGGAESLPVQTWSSSKPFAAINAAATLRSHCEQVGFVATEDNTKRPLGDLSTVIHSYETSHNLTSNCLAGYMHDIGGHAKLNANVQSWLGVSAAESLGGRYGCNETYGMGTNFTGLAPPNQHCPLISDSPQPILENHLSVLSASEFYKRLIMTRELPEFAYPYSTWDDVRELMYGTDPRESLLFPNNAFGGAATDSAWYVQSGVNISEIDERSNGAWRILSKLGAGCAGRTPPCEILNNAYACMPIAASAGDGTFALNEGVEFVLSVFGNGDDLCGADQNVQRNVAAVVAAVVGGLL